MKKIICFLFLLSCFSVYGREKARITNFHSNIIIETDGKITVSETIIVYADGNEIQRGIVRTLPDFRKDEKGKKIKMDLKILSVKRDGNDEKFKVEQAGSYKDIYIGNSETYLKPGVYEYMIIYESYGHIGFFDTYDELYWNVTGNDWVFNIEKASANIVLPGGASSVNTSCYTGYEGDSESKCTVENVGNIVTFKTTKPLSARQGLTVAISFPRDIVNRPPPPSKAELLWEAYGKIICYVLSTVILFCFYFFTWRKVGIDPEKPVVIPRFKPPHDWSPAMVRYIYKKNCDNKVFTTSLVSMAVKGAIRIRQNSKKYFLEILDRQKLLAPEEEVIFNELFGHRNEIQVSDIYYSYFAGAASSQKAKLKKTTNLKDYFLKNIGYIVGAAFLAIFLIVVSMVLTATHELSIIIFLFTLPFIFIGAFLVTASFRKDGCGMIFMFLPGVMFVWVGLSTLLTAIFGSGDIITLIYLVVMIIAFAFYVYLIKAPTELGAKTKAELEGFRLYLKTAEENRLNLLTPPKQTPELFESLLPYAIALDVENEWGKKFNNILQQANYEPRWYSGNESFRAVGFANSFTNSFTSSVQRAQVNPESSSSSGSSSGSSGSSSWSSGSSGGGFSGGGGGGGGGRGW